MYIYSIYKYANYFAMSQINLKLDSEQLARTDYLAKCVSMTRTAYIREAIAEYNANVEREVLTEKFLNASLKCRKDSILVNREMEAAEFDIDGERSGTDDQD